MTVELFAGEIPLPTGETVLLPPELLDAIQDACPEPIDGDPALAAGRTAFARRFVLSLFTRDLLLVPRGRPASRETVCIDAYSLVCSQKHALQREVADLRARIATVRPQAILTPRQWWGLVVSTFAIVSGLTWWLA